MLAEISARPVKFRNEPVQSIRAGIAYMRGFVLLFSYLIYVSRSVHRFTVKTKYIRDSPANMNSVSTSGCLKSTPLSSGCSNILPQTVETEPIKTIAMLVVSIIVVRGLI